MRGLPRLVGIVIGLGFGASNAGAYYYFTHYTSRNANPVPEKYDLNTLPNKTITFFIRDTAASTISNSNLYPSALNAIRQAAGVWNSVQSSALRVAFGGVAATGTPQNTPGADIEFDELDPLTLGFTFTNAPKNTFSSGPSGQFVPIQRPLVHLNSNLNNWSNESDPSFTEAFFLTVAHEMGHALGLQHTWTSSLMSTEVTRATSLYSPLTADDIAGVSALYPTGNFLQSTGSITGRITFSTGQGIHMASVVAITPTGPAMSALTSPDGTFRIDGVPANQYLVYVHPVPPATGSQTAPGGLQLPLNPDGTSLPADGPFDTMFYTGGTGTFSAAQGQTVNVTPGSVSSNINLTLNRRSSYTIPAVTTYSYFNQTAVRPGYLNGGGTLVAAGSGLTANGLPTPGLSVSFLGGSPSLDPTVPNNGVQAYAGSYLALYLQATSTFGGSGSRNVIFTLPDDIYVLPAGLNLVQSPPPSVASVTPSVESNGSNSLTLAGSQINGITLFYLDGVPAPLLRVDSAGRAVVSLPPGIAGAHPVVTAFNPDGQNSMFLQAGSQPTYTYSGGSAGTASVVANPVQAGTVSMIEIDGSNGNFVDGVTMVGVGSSDVQLLRSWVVAPNKIYANVQVAANASVTAATLTVITGFQIITLPAAVQILGLNGQLPLLNPQLTNATPNLTGNYPGALVTLSGSNFPGNVSIALGGQNAAVVSSTPNQITFQIPTGIPTGPTVLKFSSGSYSVSIVVQIDTPPPGVVNVAGTDNVSISAIKPARAGDVLNVLVTSLTDPQVRVNIAGVDHPVQSITPQGVASQVQIVLSPAVAPGQAPLTVSIGGRSSLPYYLTVAK